MKILKIIGLLLLLTSNAHSKDIALTFDDAPRFALGHLDGSMRAKMLIEALKKMNVKEVAFFAVSSQLDTEGYSRIKAYSNAGHIIANHTHTHPDFNVTNKNDYVSDFKKAHSLLSAFPNFEKWFRFPYLREGNEISKRDSMRKALNDLNYRNSYITINNYDWYMEEQFQREIKSNPKMDLKKFRDFYIRMLLKSVDHYDAMAIKYLGRSPMHVILLHETDLNALFITDFISALRNRGWNIISPRKAYEDDISKYITSNILNFNPGRIGEIARDNGQSTGLWDESCNEEFLEKELKKIDGGVF